MPSSKNASANRSGAATPELQKLQDLQKRIDPTQYEVFADVLAAEAARRARSFLRGVKTYRQHAERAARPPMPVVWQSGTTKLYDYNPAHSTAPVVLVIPSLINRFDILDLEPDHSFLRWLAAQGFRPMVVDWDSPGVDEKEFSITDYVVQRLVPILRMLTMQTGAPVHVLGYCMGGLLAMALAAHATSLVRSLTVMATPWNFHQPDDVFGRQCFALAEHLRSSFAAFQPMSVDLIQTLFAVLQPFKVMKKFSSFALMDSNSATARRFVALEDWLNDGVPLTAPVAEECLVEWYGQNATAKGQWRVAGCVVDPKTLPMPSYVLIPGKDRIVPPESARPLAHLLPQVTLHEPMMGHIGLIASQKAPTEVWAPLVAWLKRN